MPSHQENRFKCGHCKKMISGAHSTELMAGENIGTHHRNHCPKCLWSLHVDAEISGDRKSKCQGQMEPIGLTFKNEGQDKYGKNRQGELMIIHKCSTCGKISINRIAGDDDAKEIEKLFQKSCNDNQLREKLESENIKLLEKEDEAEVSAQLFGKKQ